MLPSLVAKYRRRGILVDTNLLIGYLIGKLNPRYLANCRATKAFTPEDFLLLDRFVRNFRQLVTTPHVLTEVSNLAGRLPDSLHREFRAALRLIIDEMAERMEPSRSIAKHQDFLRFGLADTAISMTAPGEYLVLPDELALAGLRQKRGVDVINFNHLRTFAWQ